MTVHKVQMVSIKYCGKKPRGEVEHLYGTGLVFAPGQIHLVSEDAAMKMLRHPDVYERVSEDSNADRPLLKAAWPETATVLRGAGPSKAPPELSKAPSPLVGDANKPPQRPTPHGSEATASRQRQRNQGLQGDRRRKRVDWDSVRNAYRVGMFSVRMIAKQHGISPGRVCQVAKAQGWVYRELLPLIHAKAERMVQEAVARECLAKRVNTKS